MGVGMMGNILVVDDEKSLRVTLKEFLLEDGHNVHVAEDADMAMELLEKEEIDVVVADIILPRVTGVDLLKAIRKLSSHVQVIIITGEPNLETATDAVRLGAFDYLSKPVTKEMLLRVTGHALHKKALMDEKDRIESEKERYRSNLESIFKSVNDAIVTVNDDLHVIESNPAAKSICGVTPRKIIGKNFSDVQTRCQKLCLNVLKETLKTKNAIKEYRVECKHQDRPGQVVLLSSSPLMDRNNRYVGAVLVVRDVTRLTRLERELRERHQFHNIIGNSRKMQEIYRLLENLADTETTVLITGESGTGKKLVAKALHYEGARVGNPLITVNCSALSENLLESELFGHVRGAFTGAVKDKAGRFQLAHGGTVFLDEIGDITPRIQLKLLRFLQEREFEKVGDSIPVKVDVRVIAATNRDLKKKVSLGEFREDLYYRLNVVEIALPSLRERREDIPILVDHFYRLFCKKFPKDIDGISEEVLATFMGYSWPGNVRELKHAIEHAFVLCRDRTITVDHLPSEIKEFFKTQRPVSKKNAANEPQEILRALNKTDWNKAKAARLLGISRRTIYRKIAEYKFTKPTE
jgi:two-component system response regulator HydG